jgi:hypothetical protein
MIRFCTTKVAVYKCLMRVFSNSCPYYMRGTKGAEKQSQTTRYGVKYLVFRLVQKALRSKTKLPYIHNYCRTSRSKSTLCPFIFHSSNMKFSKILALCSPFVISGSPIAEPVPQPISLPMASSLEARDPANFCRVNTLITLCIDQPEFGALPVWSFPVDTAIAVLCKSG